MERAKIKTQYPLLFSFCLIFCTGHVTTKPPLGAMERERGKKSFAHRVYFCSVAAIPLGRRKRVRFSVYLVKRPYTIQYASTVMKRCSKLIVAAAHLLAVAHGYSINGNRHGGTRLDPSRLTQKASVVDQTLRMATTRRETIRMMPNQSPMVPYRVRIPCYSGAPVIAAIIPIGFSLENWPYFGSFLIISFLIISHTDINYYNQRSLPVQTTHNSLTLKQPSTAIAP